MAAQRTYWHLQGLGRVPSDYDVATSRLLYYPERGFAVDTPVSEWYARHQAGSAFRLVDGGTFRDPRETTYAAYTALQDRAQVLVDGLYRSAGDGYDRALDAEWTAKLERRADAWPLSRRRTALHATPKKRASPRRPKRIVSNLRMTPVWLRLRPKRIVSSLRMTPVWLRVRPKRSG